MNLRLKSRMLEGCNGASLISMNKLTGSFFVLFFLSLSFSTHSWAAKAPKQKVSAKAALGSVSPLAQVPDALGAKAFLEDLLAKRYAQELATVVDRQEFSLGARLDLIEIEPPKPPAPKPSTQPDPEPTLPPDLLLGTLDPVDLLKKYADPEVRVKMSTFLSGFRISNVSMSVGLKEDLNPEVKSTVEKWLNERLKAEFGAIGKGVVTLIQQKIEKEKKKTFLDELNRFQTLAGQLLIALAILLGAILFLITRGGRSKKTQEELTKGAGASAAGTSPTPPAGPPGDITQKIKAEEQEALKIAKEIREFKRQLAILAPRVAAEAETVIRSWCQEPGEEGKLKLACFAEAAGNNVGKLPIPPDAFPDLTQTFAKMPSIEPKEKRDILKKIYWDLQTAINLGSSTFEHPFGYLGSVDTTMVNQVLIEQNAKMKTLVSLYMPPKLRESYMSSLDEAAKRILLEEASGMSELPSDQFKTMESDFKSRLQPSDKKDVVILDSALQKLVQSLTPMDEMTLLPGITGGGLKKLKMSVPSLAFIDEWPDDKLAILISRAMPDEIVAYLRIRPQSRDRIMAFCTPMTAEVAADELSRSDSTTDTEKTRVLAGFTNRIKTMVAGNEIDLAKIFAGSNNQGSGNDTTQAA